jgi:hypothetical protein
MQYSQEKRLIRDEIQASYEEIENPEMRLAAIESNLRIIELSIVNPPLLAMLDFIDVHGNDLDFYLFNRELGMLLDMYDEFGVLNNTSERHRWAQRCFDNISELPEIFVRYCNLMSEKLSSDSKELSEFREYQDERIVQGIPISQIAG